MFARQGRTVELGVGIPMSGSLGPSLLSRLFAERGSMKLRVLEASVEVRVLFAERDALRMISSDRRSAHC